MGYDQSSRGICLHFMLEGNAKRFRAHFIEKLSLKFPKKHKAITKLLKHLEKMSYHRTQLIVDKRKVSLPSQSYYKIKAIE